MYTQGRAVVSHLRSRTMKIPRLAGIVFVFLVGFGIGVGALGLAVRDSEGLRYHLLERSGDIRPQELVAAFVKAIVENNRSGALELWKVNGVPMQEELAKRREMVVSDLMQAGIQPDYMILGIEWWRACCEPSVTCNPRDAGGARISVQFLDGEENPVHYTFDIFTRKPYWGAAAGYPPREWVIRDVYPEGQKPLFWPLVYEPRIHGVRP